MPLVHAWKCDQCGEQTVTSLRRADDGEPEVGVPPGDWVLILQPIRAAGGERVRLDLCPDCGWAVLRFLEDEDAVRNLRGPQFGTGKNK